MSKDYESRDSYIKKVSLAASKGRDAARLVQFEDDEEKKKKKRDEDYARQEKEREQKLERARKALDKSSGVQKEDSYDDEGLDLEEGLHGNFRNKFGPEAAYALKEARQKHLERKKMKKQKEEEDAKKPILDKLKGRIFGR